MISQVLLVEDDPALSFATKFFLSKQGFAVTDCANAETAYQKFMKKVFDICLIDVVLPGKSGLDLVRQIRDKNSKVPVIILSGKIHDQERIAGMEAGADCYLIKPYSLPELVMRIRVFLKYRRQNDEATRQFKIGRLTFNFQEMKLALPEQSYEHPLTQREGELLHYLCLNAGNIVKRDQLLVDLWGKTDPYLGRSLDVFVNRLRKYFRFEQDVEIKTIHGVGFKLMLSGGQPEAQQNTDTPGIAGPLMSSSISSATK